MNTKIVITIVSSEPDYPLHAIADLMEKTAKELRDKASEFDVDIPPAFGNVDIRDELDGHLYAQGNYIVERK
jgi:hypothetical protein